MSPSVLKPLIIGHRGASATAPENTMISFERAMDDGADGIEFDVQLARDGVPVVIHDASLKRTGLRSARVAELSSGELEKLDVGTWFNLRNPARARQEYRAATVPTLAGVLEYFRRRETVLYIEMKCSNRDSYTLASEVVRLINENQLANRAVVESFALDSIRDVRRIDPAIRTAALFEPKISRPVRSKLRMIERALNYDANEIALHRTLASARTIEEAKRHGLHVVVWTVDHPSWVGKSIKNGIHAIITNEPARMFNERRDFTANNIQLSLNAPLL